MVAADQLDQAREIAARPIPKEIVEQSKMQTPEFEPPVCPNCGAGDPVLESVDPVNSWRCEACGKEWSESARLSRVSRKSAENDPSKTERAARQQGSSLLRENSSNGGKTIRTFWLHSRSGGTECQGEISAEISYLYFNIFSEGISRGNGNNCSMYVRLYLPVISRLLGVFLRVYVLFSTG